MALLGTVSRERTHWKGCHGNMILRIEKEGHWCYMRGGKVQCKALMVFLSSQVSIVG